MTNEQAIELLHRLQDEQFDGIHGDERREALSMAVRALEQNLVQESGGLVKDLVNDCISRKMAIDALRELQRKIVASDGCHLGISASIEEIKNVPSAQPQRKKGRWIITKTERAWNCGEYPIEVTCSNCGYIEDYHKKNNYCPSCGDDMRGENDEQNKR